MFNKNEYWADKYKRTVVLCTGHHPQIAKHLLSHGGGQEGGKSGEYGAVGTQEVGEERRELGVIKCWEVGEKREIMKQCLTFCKEKRLKVGVQAKRGGSRECKALEVGDLDSLSPLPLSHLLRTIIHHRPNFLICGTRTVLVNLLHNMILSCWDKRLTKFIT